MAPPKGKGKGRKAGPQEEYNGFCAPVSLLYDTFKSNVAASGGRVLPEQAAPVLAMLQKEPDDKLTQINIGDPIGPACVEQLCRTVQQIYFLGIRSVCFWNAQLGGQFDSSGPFTFAFVNPTRQTPAAPTFAVLLCTWKPCTSSRSLTAAWASWLPLPSSVTAPITGLIMTARLTEHCRRTR